MGLILRTNGSTEVFEPANKTDYTFEEIRPKIDCRMIELVYLGNQILCCDEEALMIGEPVFNRNATALARKVTGLEYNIYGDVLLCHDNQIK